MGIASYISGKKSTAALEKQLAGIDQKVAGLEQRLERARTEHKRAVEARRTALLGETTAAAQRKVESAVREATSAIEGLEDALATLNAERVNIAGQLEESRAHDARLIKADQCDAEARAIEAVLADISECAAGIQKASVTLQDKINLQHIGVRSTHEAVTAAALREALIASVIAQAAPCLKDVTFGLDSRIVGQDFVGDAKWRQPGGGPTPGAPVNAAVPAMLRRRAAELRGARVAVEDASEEVT